MRFSVVLLLLTTIGLAAAVRKQFPRHWGPPPRIQTMDIVPLPDGYGRGSSTLANWIKRKMERDQRQPNAIPKLKQFPAHWGQPPRIQTKDYRPLPGGFGRGSSTLARWIQNNLNRDARIAATKLKPIYANDLTEEATGEPGDGFLVLDGAFAIKSAGGNKLLELPGAPLSTKGVLFGPTESTNIAVQAKVFTTNSGRRFSTFGVGLNGVGGYRLQVTPAKRKLELFKQDKVVASVPYQWEPGKWTWAYLQVRSVRGKRWRVEGSAWVDGEAKPADFLIRFDDQEEPYAGRAAIWGQPFAGHPIQYDELTVFRVP